MIAYNLNIGVCVFGDIINDVLQHRKWNSVNFTHYIRLQVLKSRRRWWIHSIFEVSP